MTAGKKRILIVVNPISGGRSKVRFINMASSFFGPFYDIQWLYWKDLQQNIPEEVRREISEREYACVIAAGGDGTVNQTAQGLVGSDVPMGIIPLGSGNGLARHLGYRIRIKDSMETIHRGKVIRIDAAMVNDGMFFCSSGTGFDAHIGHIFAGLGKRGPARYVQSVVKELGRYRSRNYIINVDGAEYHRKAFLVTVANAGQYGNNAWIAPRASLQDGLLDVTVLHPFSVINAPVLAVNLFRKKIDRSQKVETFRGKSIRVTDMSGNEDIPVHYDGEPAVMKNQLEYSIWAAALSVIVP
jgi:YegS/Rv2252/BmrU family lipid kinase